MRISPSTPERAGDPEQLQGVVNLLQGTLGEDLIGVYLFGSAVLGGLKPSSDLDVMAVSARSTSLQEKRNLVSALRERSGKPRHLELTIVVQHEVKPWRYPPRMDFQYGDWWDDEYDRGNVQPWRDPANPDLASLIRMALLADTPMLGPAPADVFDPVPREDYVASLLGGIEELLGDIEWDTRNVVLTLARMWASVETDEVLSKDAAAQWALARLPSNTSWVLAEARSMYVGQRDHWSRDPLPDARSYAHHVILEIRGSSRRG